jgi:hypothetical protein
LFTGREDDMTFTLTLKRSEVSGHAGAIHLAAFQGDAVRSARALHDAIRNAVLLDALPDEVVVSLDKLNQLKNAIAAEHAAADRRADDHNAALWGFAWTATIVTLVAIATFG